MAVDPRAFAQRHHRGEHRQARGVRRGHRHAPAGEREGGLDEPAPGRRPCARQRMSSPAGRPGTRTTRRRRRSRRAPRRTRPAGAASACRAGRNGDEAVEVANRAALGLQVDAVSAAEQARHDRLGDAGGEARSDRRVRGAAAVLEDLGARLGSGLVARRDGGDHDTRSARRLPNRPNPSIGKSNRSPRLRRRSPRRSARRSPAPAAPRRRP